MYFRRCSSVIKSLISIKTLIDYENSGHLWYKLSQICLQKLKGPCQISSYFWVFWGKIQLSSGHKVSWFRVGWKILLDLIFPHVGLSSMLFWGQSEDPPTFMICGFKKEHVLNWNLFSEQWEIIGFKRCGKYLVNYHFIYHSLTHIFWNHDWSQTLGYWNCRCFFQTKVRQPLIIIIRI